MENSVLPQLDEALDDFVVKLPLPESSFVMPTRTVDLLTSIVPVVWFAWVIRNRDLRLWTQVLLSISLLATLKGFLAWATVAPDAHGWGACRERLRPDGLKYYRRHAGSSIDTREIDNTEVFLDILLLEVRGLWMVGKEHRRRYCGGTMFSSTVYVCVIFCMSLAEAMHISSQRLPARRQLMVQGLAGCILSGIVAGNAALSVLNHFHYSVDVAAGVILGLLVYTNPAVALAVEWWAQGADRLAVLTEADDASLTELPVGPKISLTSADRQPAEVGRVFVPGCCMPFCCQPEGFYYLRDGVAHLPKEEGSDEIRRQQLEHFQTLKEQLLRCLRKKEEILIHARTDAQVRAAHAELEAQKRLEEALADQARRLESQTSGADI